MFLKWSRSMNSTATLPVRALRRARWRGRGGPASSERLGRPVRLSWYARCWMRCWITLRSVTSRELNTTPWMCGLARQLVPSDSNVRHAPSRCRKRTSSGPLDWRVSTMRRTAARRCSASSACTRSKHVAAHGVGRVVAQEHAQRPALVAQRAVGIDHGDQVERALGEHPEARLARLQRPLRLLVARDVGDGADEARDLALLVDEAHLVVEHLARLAERRGHHHLVGGGRRALEQRAVALVVRGRRCPGRTCRTPSCRSSSRRPPKSSPQARLCIV